LKALDRIEVNTQTLTSHSQIINSHTQSLARLEIQIDQLAASLGRRKGGKLPSQPESKPRGQFMAESSNIPKIFSEHTKSVMTLRNGKVIEQPSRTNETYPTPPTQPESEPSKDKEDLRKEDEPIAPEPPYLLKVPYLDALKAAIPAEKKKGGLEETLKLFKQV